ncbi:ATPdependent DNA ligase domain containing protein [Acanthamoeba castellanii str. Neff]|uniref:DNA ligase n=1 Tax=Acanthamoeba castellanii (strain ATCC 30010 / Neff) TaxID=1257118 RepID=L8H6T3_ACACF|nr:ATPdependent DNA ligase domain containing protein [Acanthamoeba castellanii str. Neff]ELR20952.1 ATPdependent DNA ligase domain containing protein [Acanthamoeba castellanii str. Neff]
MKETGDVGLVGELAKGRQKTIWTRAASSLTCGALHKTLLTVTTLKGNESTKRKRDTIKQLLVSCQKEEARYIIRILQGNLRIGVLEKTLYVALAHALFIEKRSSSNSTQTASWPSKEEFKSVAKLVTRAFNEMPCYDSIIPLLLEKENLLDLSHEHLLIPGNPPPPPRPPEAAAFMATLPSSNAYATFCSPGTPVKPMLSSPSSGPEDIVARFGAGVQFLCEYKYDGERAQIHKVGDNKYAVYSRRLEDHTSKFPDLIACLPQYEKETTQSYIIGQYLLLLCQDGEIVAYDRESKKILPFQTLTTRARKNVDLDAIKVQVCFYAFDILYINKEVLVNLPLVERRKRLESEFVPVDGGFQMATSQLAATAEELSAHFDSSLQQAHIEGLVVKLWTEATATYELGKRSLKWLKLKRDYLEGCADTLDLVVMGGFYGRGKRAGVFGSYLLGVWDPENEEYQATCKCMTGFSDEFLLATAKYLNEGDNLLAKPLSYYRYGAEPDVWFKPTLVWEVHAAGISLSPTYPAAAHLLDGRGLSLRFPRFKRERTDKKPEDASPPETARTHNHAVQHPTTSTSPCSPGTRIIREARGGHKILAVQSPSLSCLSVATPYWFVQYGNSYSQSTASRRP